jgi:predicted dehydrogenase
MADLGLALIGCGQMGTNIARECLKLDGVRLVGAWDRDSEIARALATRFDVTPFPDLRTLVHNPGVDGVMIATPPAYHRRYAAAAAGSGKHVFCEKPMATTLSACDDIIDRCRRAGVRLMIGHLTRFHPLLAYVHAAVERRVLGEPACIVINRLGGSWSDGDWHRPWRLKRNESGGALLEINSHELDFLRLIGGPVESVYAVGGRYRQHEADYADQTLVSLRFASGAIGQLHASQASAIGSYAGRVDCTEGSIVFPSIFGAAPVVHMARFGEKQRTIGPDEFAETSPIREEIAAFADAIRHDADPPVTGHDGRAVVELAMASYESLDTGRPVRIPLR